MSPLDHFQSYVAANWHQFLTVDETKELTSLGSPRRTNSANAKPPDTSTFLSTVTRDDKYSSVSKSGQRGAFAADGLECNLHNA